MACTKDTKLCNWGKQSPLNPCCIDHLKEILIYIDRLFKEHSIIYWIDFGTLLGMYREKNIITHDYDADCSTNIIYSDKIASLSQQVSNDGYVLDSSNGNVVHRIFYSDMNKLHVDIFMFKQRKKVMECQYKPAFDFLNKHIDPLGEIECWGHVFAAPNDVPGFLEMRYGEDYMTPRVNYYGPVRRGAHDGTNMI